MNIISYIASYFGILMRGTPVWWAAILFYVFYAVGLLILVIAPHAGEVWWHVALYAALLGFVAYMTFDLTGLAIISAFPIKTVAADIAWGTLASGIAGTVGYFIINAIK